MDLRTYWRSVYRLRGGFKAKAAPLVNQIYSNDKEAKEQAINELMEVIEQYRTHTYKIGVRLLTQEANKLNADPFIPDAQPYQKRWLEQAMRETKSPAGLLLRLEKHVTAAGRRVITQAVPAPVAGGTTDNPGYKQAQPYREEDMTGTQEKTGAKTGPSGRRLIYPVAFARVLSGPRNCAFCVMLASRGPVYSSASHAGAKGVKGVFTAWTPSSQWPNSFHDSCDCLVVPVYNPTGAWMGKSQSEYLYKFWLQTTKGKTNLKDSGGENESLIAFRQKLTEMKENGETLDIEDLRETDTDKTKEAEPQENNSPEAPQTPEQNLIYQEKEPEVEELDQPVTRLKYPTREVVDPSRFKELASEIPKNERMYIEELQFLQDFEALGHTARWIPHAEELNSQGGALPSNDFAWEGTEELWELKTPERPLKKNIYRLIRTAVAGANKANVVKENFVIYLLDWEVSDQLRKAISEYNQSNPNNKVSRVLIMHKGVLEEIKQVP